MEKTVAFDLELVRKTIRSAEEIIFYPDLDDIKVENDKLVLTPG